MKYLGLMLFVLIFIVSCQKKTDQTVPLPTSSPLNLGTGFRPATDSELQTIPFFEDSDTLLFPAFGRVMGLPNTWSIDVPSSTVAVVNESCVGWSVGYGCLSYQFKIAEENPDYSNNNVFSPSYIWNQLNGGGNRGLSIPSAINLVFREGCSKWSPYMPFINSTTDIAQQPSSDARLNAADHKAFAARRFKLDDLDEGRIKRNLYKNYPLPFGINVDNTFGTGNMKPSFETRDGRLVWKQYGVGERKGHCMLLCGYDDNIRAYKVLNNWGSNWSNNGYGWIDYDFFRKNVIQNNGSIEVYMVEVKSKPVLNTTAITTVSQTTALSGGEIKKLGGYPAIQRGLCWSLSPNPTIINNNNKTSEGPVFSKGSFTSTITGLKANTLYYVRAYAFNITDTAYGNDVSFTTLQSTATLPILSTNNVTSITQTSAVSGGNITNDGGSAITARGVCWSTTQNPSIANNKTSDGTGVGSFTSSITGLTSLTTYYVRAYATNSTGTAYGNQESFIAGKLDSGYGKVLFYKRSISLGEVLKIEVQKGGIGGTLITSGILTTRAESSATPRDCQQTYSEDLLLTLPEGGYGYVLYRQNRATPWNYGTFIITKNGCTLREPPF